MIKMIWDWILCKVLLGSKIAIPKKRRDFTLSCITSHYDHRVQDVAQRGTFSWSCGLFSVLDNTQSCTSSQNVPPCYAKSNSSSCPKIHEVLPEKLWGFVEKVVSQRHGIKKNFNNRKIALYTIHLPYHEEARREGHQTSQHRTFWSPIGLDRDAPRSMLGYRYHRYLPFPCLLP